MTALRDWGGGGGGGAYLLDGKQGGGGLELEVLSTPLHTHTGPKILLNFIYIYIYI